MAQNTEPTIIVLTGEALDTLVKTVQEGFEQINARLDLMGVPAPSVPIRKIGSQSDKNRRVATNALKETATRPTRSKRTVAR